MFYTLLIILASLVIMPAAIRNCCDDGESIQSMSFDFCSDGKKVSIVCADGSTTRLSNSWQEFKQYVIGEDERGEYLDAWGSGYVSRAPQLVHLNQTYSHICALNRCNLFFCVVFAKAYSNIVTSTIRSPWPSYATNRLRIIRK